MFEKMKGGHISCRKSQTVRENICIKVIGERKKISQQKREEN